MGDRRFQEPYDALRQASDARGAIAEMGDERVIEALAYAGLRRDAYVTNVLATEAMNRARRASALVDNAFDGLVALDERGWITSLNPAAETLLGYAEADARGHPFHALVHHTDLEGRPIAEDACPILGALRGEDARGYMTGFTRADGGRFPVEVNVQAIHRDGEVFGCVVDFRDVTDRFEADERRAQLLRGLAEGVVVFDPEGRVELANPAAERILGVSLAAMLAAPPGSRAWTTLDPTRRKIQYDDLASRRAIATGEPVLDTESILQRPDGSEAIVSASAVPLRAAGRVMGVVVSFHDITKQRELDERYRSLFTQDPSPVFAIDEGGSFLAVNAAAEQLVGRSAEELVGAPFAPLVAEEELPLAFERFAEVLSGATREDPYTLVRSDGTRIRVHVLGMPIVVNGRIVGMHGRAREV